MKVSDSLNEKQITQLHRLYQKEWWTAGRSLAETEKCVRNSQLCIALLDGDRLIGFARVVTDFIFKALIFDVIIDDAYRGRGLGKELMRLIKDHERLQGVKHLELYCLPEMAAFYREFGFSDKTGGVLLLRCER